MGSSSRSATSLQLCVLTILSAFLLFQVQPVISKFILPWYGGSPGVWTTCMLFFQVVLFAGYAYAHALTRLPRRWQGLIHGVLVLGASASLPISPGAQWKPSGADDPTQSILLLLLANVALPYFVLSSTSPLVQVWFSRDSGGRAPWRLYALSNLGSLAALLSYPFFFEPRWDVMQQTWMWSGAFVAFGILSLLGAYTDWKKSRASHEVTAVEPGTTLPPASPRWWQRLLWLVLPAVASVLLLASTNHLCQDVAVIPFLWVVPLSLYLLTFIICFEHERWYVRWLWALLAMTLLFAAAVPADFASIISKMASTVMFKEISLDITPTFRWEIALVCGAMFLGCMVCHGELARLKPDPSCLTEFYLMMSAGGALGGLFVSQAAPRLFKTYVEWPGVLLATFAVGTFGFVLSAWQTKNRWGRMALAAAALTPAGIGISNTFKKVDAAEAFIGGPLQQYPSLRYVLAVTFVVGSIGVIGVAWQRRNRWSRLIAASAAAYLTGVGVWWIATNAFETETRVEIVRNFYGVISVQDEFDDAGEGWRTLYHGSILHGRQFLSDSWDHEPLSYYGHETGVGLALLTLKSRTDARVGVVGMGAGTVASYGQKGHMYRFYDINPEIVRLARTRFRYLQGMEAHGGKIEVALGDARLSLENEGPQQFDVLLLDAFSGDSVPVHLLTQEAFEIYLRHMKPDGIIAVHVSNRYLALAPMVQRVAESLGMRTTRVLTELDGFDEATDYVMVTNNATFLNSHPPELPSTPEPPPTLWTDRRHNLFECLITTDD